MQTSEELHLASTKQVAKTHPLSQEVTLWLTPHMTNHRLVPVVFQKEGKEDSGNKGGRKMKEGSKLAGK